MTHSKINLVYIASIGRSGTTLLDSMLGAHSQMVSVGELHIWPHELRTPGGVRPCACGQPVQVCPFWSQVRDQTDPLQQPGPHLDHFREKHNAGRTLRRERLKEFGPASLSEPVQAQIERYGRNTYDIYHTVREVARTTFKPDATWIVDSSKDPYRLLWLVRSGLFNVRVVHMVKNPRGFVYSVTKQYLNRRGGLRAPRQLYYTARQSVAWSVRNRLISNLARHHLPSEAYLLMHYERLASEPEAAMQRISEFTGVPYEAQTVHDFRAGAVHTIAGNPMRYEERGIALDERWKQHLPYGSRKLTEWVTGPFRGRYGYS